MTDKIKKPELLAPAGDMERLMAAVKYGADAVYLGGTTFGMRAAPSNFSDEELKTAVDYCHERGLEQTGVHRFRHTFAKKWATMGGSVVTLQKILGHSSLAITENYLNVLTSDLQKDIEKVNIIRSLKQERVKMRA